MAATLTVHGVSKGRGVPWQHHSHITLVSKVKSIQSCKKKYQQYVDLQSRERGVMWQHDLYCIRVSKIERRHKMAPKPQETCTYVSI